MATNLALDPKLLDQVLELSGEPTKKAAVTLALKEFVARREQKKLAELFGKLDWDPGYDYKSERQPARSAGGDSPISQNSPVIAAKPSRMIGSSACSSGAC